MNGYVTAAADFSFCLLLLKRRKKRRGEKEGKGQRFGRPK